MLKLRIENFDQLPDGGPIEYTADRRGFDFGREQHLDWTLPDDSGVISRKHCEIRFFEQSYWLFDLSTNGTFLNKSTKRIQSPYKLADGDEIRIGDYVISVSLPAMQSNFSAAAVERAPAVANAARPGGIWESDGAASPPIDPRELMPPVPEHRRAPDYFHQVVHLPPVNEPAPRPRPASAGQYAPPPTVDLWGGPAAEPPAFPAPPPAPPPPPALPPDVFGAAAEVPFQPSAPIYQPQPVRPEFTPQPVAPQGQDSGREFLQRFAKGAGLPVEHLNGKDAGQLAEEAGFLLNLVCGHLMQLLSARAAAKTLAKSGKRTLISPSENNPLKFTPTPEEALRVMFGPATSSYLNSRQTIDSSFADLKTHQLATLTAMQHAATRILEDMSPEAIRKEVDGMKKSLLSSGKGRYWETYTEKWAAKSARSEHGMLGAFLEVFAAYYDQQSSSNK